MRRNASEDRCCGVQDRSLPELICVCPQAIRLNGMALLSSPMMKKPIYTRPSRGMIWRVKGIKARLAIPPGTSKWSVAATRLQQGPQRNRTRARQATTSTTSPILVASWRGWQREHSSFCFWGCRINASLACREVSNSVPGQPIAQPSSDHHAPNRQARCSQSPQDHPGLGTAMRRRNVHADVLASAFPGSE